MNVEEIQYINKFYFQTINYCTRNAVKHRLNIIKHGDKTNSVTDNKISSNSAEQGFLIITTY